VIAIIFYEVTVRRRTNVQARWLFQGEPLPIFSERRPEKVIGYKGVNAYGAPVERTAKYQQDSTFEVEVLGRAEPPIYPIRQRLTFLNTKDEQPRVVVAVYWTEKGWRYLTRIEGSDTEHYEPEMHLGGDRWVYESHMRRPSAVTLLS